VHPVCASRLDTLLKGPLDTISVVSSLPFRSLPQGDRKQIEQAILRLSRHSRTFRFIQYSYLGRLPFPVDSTHPLQWTRRRTVLGNLPPATVWVLAPITDEPQKHTRPHRQQAFRARLALFAAALCPLAIWLISSGRLARPGKPRRGRCCAPC
jgi:hypothetical protein